MRVADVFLSKEFGCQQARLTWGMLTHIWSAWHDAIILDEGGGQRTTFLAKKKNVEP
jgi:hypothetical protein